MTLPWVACTLKPTTTRTRHPSAKVRAVGHAPPRATRCPAACAHQRESLPFTPGLSLGLARLPAGDIGAGLLVSKHTGTAPRAGRLREGPPPPPGKRRGRCARHVRPRPALLPPRAGPERHYLGAQKQTPSPEKEGARAGVMQQHSGDTRLLKTKAPRGAAGRAGRRGARARAAFPATYSKAKKSPLVSRMSTSVR